MKLYSDIQEENLFIRKQSAVWKNSGLINSGQTEFFNKYTDPKLRTTNLFLRILLFIFASIFISSFVGFTLYLLDSRQAYVLYFTLLIFCVPVYLTGEYAVRNYTLYRHGVEEAFALGGAVLLYSGLGIFFHDIGISHEPLVVIYCLVSAAALLALYARFGYLYAFIAGCAALCIIPFQLSLSNYEERLLTAAILGCVIYLTVKKDKTDIYCFIKDKNAVI